MTLTPPPTGRLDWRAVLQWLHDDGVIDAREAARVRSRFGAGDSSQHPLVRLAGAGLTDARHAGRALDTIVRRRSVPAQVLV